MTYGEYVRIQALMAARPDSAVRLRQIDEPERGRFVDLGDGVRVSVCPFRDSESGRCAVYDARPLVCRLMGYVPWMPCPVGRVTNAMPPDEALAVLREYCREPRRSYQAWREQPGAERGIANDAMGL